MMQQRFRDGFQRRDFQYAENELREANDVVTGWEHKIEFFQRAKILLLPEDGQVVWRGEGDSAKEMVTEWREWVCWNRYRLRCSNEALNINSNHQRSFTDKYGDTPGERFGSTEHLGSLASRYQDMFRKLTKLDILINNIMIAFIDGQRRQEMRSMSVSSRSSSQRESPGSARGPHNSSQRESPSSARGAQNSGQRDSPPSARGAHSLSQRDSPSSARGLSISSQKDSPSSARGFSISSQRESPSSAAGLSISSQRGTPSSARGARSSESRFDSRAEILSTPPRRSLNTVFSRGAKQSTSPETSDTKDKANAALGREPAISPVSRREYRPTGVALVEDDPPETPSPQRRRRSLTSLLGCVRTP